MAERGLSAAEVAQRVATGQVNDVPSAPTRTIGQIVRANVLTRFNPLLGGRCWSSSWSSGRSRTPCSGS